MASTDRDYELSALGRRLRRDRQESNARSIWTRGRAIEAGVHGQQLAIVVDENRDMRDPATGKLWFVQGYSRVSDTGTDGDLVRPT